MQHGSEAALRNEIRVLRRDLEKWRNYALLQEMIANVAYYKKRAERFEAEVQRLQAERCTAVRSDNADD